MSINDVPAMNSFHDEIGIGLKKAALSPVDASDDPGGQAKARVKQKVSIVGQATTPVAQMDCGGNQDWIGALVEGDHCGDEAIKLPCHKAAGQQHLLQCLVFAQTAHHDQPVYYLSANADRETVTCLHQRRHGLIDIGSQPAIERQLGPACRFATIERRKVEVGKADGLLQLDDVLACQKDPRHVRLAGDDLFGRKRVGVRAAEKRNLGVQ